MAQYEVDKIILPFVGLSYLILSGAQKKWRRPVSEGPQGSRQDARVNPQADIFMSYGGGCGISRRMMHIFLQLKSHIWGRNEVGHLTCK